jgi:sigma-54 dependent transcriptional regulator, flagellar regulatory protein
MNREQIEHIVTEHQKWLETAGAQGRCCDFSGQNLEGVELPKAKLSKGKFLETNLREARLQNADLSQCDFRGAIFNRAYLRCTNFEGADLRNTQWAQAVVEKANFENARLSSANMSEVYNLVPNQIQNAETENLTLSKKHEDWKSRTKASPIDRDPQLSDPTRETKRKSNSPVNSAETISVVQKKTDPETFLGERVIGLIDRFASQTSSVLFQGERGTYKDLAAKELHKRSNSSKPYTKLDCQLLSISELSDYYLQHHKKIPNGGYVFLCNVDHLSLENQRVILSMIEGDSLSAGRDAEPSFLSDARIIASTTANLKSMVDDGAFDDRLYYKISVLSIRLAPLREHSNDIPNLVSYYIRKKCQSIGLPDKLIPDETMSALVRYSWPGNIREMETVLERLVVMSDKSELTHEQVAMALDTIEAVPERTKSAAQSVGITGDAIAELVRMVIDQKFTFDKLNEEIEEAMVTAAMMKSNNVKTRAAEILGIKTSALYYKLGKFGIK